jgi:small subunit ribosomal protein S1
MWTTCKPGDTISGKINKQVKAGYLIRTQSKGTVFLPFSQVKVGHFNIAEEAPKYVGKVYDFKVLNVSQERKNMVVSLREIEEETLKKDKAEKFKQVAVGEQMSGVVVNILDYGAFVDVGNLVGLLHVNDLGIEQPYDMFKKGQKVSVKVLVKDEDKNRISFGLEK